MLNDAMDEVVLVKGWKKGANWSFPRGKINKDEKDLDCAVREVYEETGYDIQAAGLVKEEKDMKYIEVTMREQHIRLYVFRGVPKDTYFEPRTRKEISKIEWWKLTDLPTLKKHKHQDSNGDGQGISLNKFYMVAPFINPLKKWIAQQRKKDCKQNLHPGHLVAAPLVEETATEDERDQDILASHPPLVSVTSHGPSDLPEVSVSRTKPSISDPSEHLKRLLKMNESNPNKILIPKALPNYDAAKSSALLALLRGDSTPELRADPRTPLEQMSFPPEVARSPHRHHPHPPPFSAMPPPPPFPVAPDNRSDQVYPSRQGYHTPDTLPFDGMYRQEYQTAPGSNFESNWIPPAAPGSGFAPPQGRYQPMIDPGNTQTPSIEPQRPAGPPASALPTLTNHTKALLDMFKSEPVTQGQPQSPRKSQVLPHDPAPWLQPQSNIPAAEPSLSANNRFVQPHSPQRLPGVYEDGTVFHRPGSEHQANLLDLFRQSPTTRQASVLLANQQKPAVELAANPATAGPENQLLTILRRDKQAVKSIAAKSPPIKQPGEGETSATIMGPLNLPQFEGIRSSRRSSNELKRSPVAAHRTLYDPNQPTPIKILARPDDGSRSPARSPRQSKFATGAGSPKRPPTHKEPTKPFQPQILRRPQTAESQNGLPLSINVPKVANQPPPGTEPPKPKVESPVSPTIPSTTRIAPSEAHKQTLLSLFGRPAETAAMTSSPLPPTIAATVPQPPTSAPITPPPPHHDLVSPLAASQLVSPLDNEPISTRSRMSSLTSTASGAGRMRQLPHQASQMEKRQTTAGDKAFLLGYLSRIASQES